MKLYVAEVDTESVRWLVNDATLVATSQIACLKSRALARRFIHHWLGRYSPGRGDAFAQAGTQSEGKRMTVARFQPAMRDRPIAHPIKN